MGAIHAGVPPELALFIRDTFGIKTFIETGTGDGTTALWANEHFDKVVTIDGDYKSILPRCPDKKFSVIIGDSPKVLAELVPNLKEACLFWLDAHWMGEGSFKGEYECPTLQELNIINMSRKNNVILIDDARYFMAPPPRPHDDSQWPDIRTVIDWCNNKGGNEWRRTYISEDVIVSVPEEYDSKLRQFLRDQYDRPIQTA